MSLPVLAIRAQPGCAATVGAGAAAGLAVEPWPLFEIRPLAWPAPPPDAVNALLLGSANALRHGGPALAAYRGKPALCVGEATADAARAAGLDVAAIGSGGLQALLDTQPRLPPSLLRIAGEEHLPLASPPGVAILTRIAYRSVAAPLPPALAARLSGGAVVLLHSAAAAQHLAAECDRLAIPRAALALAALGPRIAAAAGSGWRALRWAQAPCEGALLALAAQMCHDPRETTL
ncbi:MAG: uroporphyrinogen-III synthase [Porphyrobacter sp.]|nr:uroporphyrinogen-III synthase [Porphyrobacter sp.]